MAITKRRSSLLEEHVLLAAGRYMIGYQNVRLHSGILVSIYKKTDARIADSRLGFYPTREAATSAAKKLVGLLVPVYFTASHGRVDPPEEGRIFDAYVVGPRGAVHKVKASRTRS